MAKNEGSTEKANATTSQLRLLIITPYSDPQKSHSLFPSFLQKLTGTSPPSDQTTFAGYTSHPPLYIKTRYYESNVTVWCDELPSTETEKNPQSRLKANDTAPAEDPTTVPIQPTLSEWQAQMLSTSAREVRDVIGGIIILLPLAKGSSPPASTNFNSTSASKYAPQVSAWLPYIEAVSTLRDAIEDESARDVASIVVLQDMNSISKLEADALLDDAEEEYVNTHGIMGWDFVLWQSQAGTQISGDASSSPAEEAEGESKRNEFGEMTGFPRILEVLQGTDWTARPSAFSDGGDDGDDDMSDSDPFELIDRKTVTSKANAEDSTSPILSSLRSSLLHGTNTDKDQDGEPSTPPQIPQSHHSFDQDSTQIPDQDQDQIADQALHRDLLMLKMSLQTPSTPHSTHSSLAGQFDTDDFGMRTPAPMMANRLQEIGTPMFRADSGRESRRGVTKGGDEDVPEEGDAMQVEQLTGLMERVVAMREHAEGLPEAEREKFARREVNRIMKELG